MIYANDQWIQLPVKDLYDTQMMLASINVAKDLYEKGLQEIKDFKKEYGDFLSPIQKDMDWYDQNVTGKVRDVINNLYANGIDPLRSAEGRAAISKVINNIDAGKANWLRLRAENAKQWYKNMGDLKSKGLYNEDFSEDFLKETPQDWADNYVGSTSPTVYKDLNQYTSHIFDALDDSFIESKDGYDYYGINPDQMYNSLTPDTLGGLLRNDVGRFHYNNARNDLIKQGVTNPTDDLIVEQFKRNVVAANNEKVHRNRKLNELYKIRLENAYRAARSGGGGGSRGGYVYNPQQNNQWSFAEMVRRLGVTSTLGKQIEEYSPEMLTQVRDRQMEIGKRASDITKGHSLKAAGIQTFENEFGKNRYRLEDVARFLGYPMWDEQTYTMTIPKNQLYKLHDNYDVVSNTVGFRGKKQNTSRKDLENADIVVITPTTGSYQSFAKDAKYKNYFEMTVTPMKREVSVVNNKEIETYKPVGKQRRMYIDSHITSVQNDPRLGYLGTKDAKTGKIIPIKGVDTVNSQDTRFQDAIIADKITTDAITKGTIFGSDATISELSGYAQ